MLLRITEQPADVQVPDMEAGEGCGCPLVQPEPETETDTLPATLAGMMVPVIVPLMVQLSQVSPAKGMAKVPLLLTTVVPEELGAAQLVEPG